MTSFDPDESATKDIFRACQHDENRNISTRRTAADLKDAFADIAADLVQLHVSK
ncbi:MAG: hypothetical protein R3C42_04385 [Parvularculaceae bacterium]